MKIEVDYKLRKYNHGHRCTVKNCHKQPFYLSSDAFEDYTEIPLCEEHLKILWEEYLNNKEENK